MKEKQGKQGSESTFSRPMGRVRAPLAWLPLSMGSSPVVIVVDVTTNELVGNRYRKAESAAAGAGPE